MLYSGLTYISVVAIDFGTSFSGFAFAFNHKEGETGIHMNKDWGADQGYSTPKTPTCLLLNPDKSFNSFGYEAQDRFAELDDDQSQEYYYFEQFKMILHNNEVSVDLSLHWAHISISCMYLFKYLYIFDYLFVITYITELSPTFFQALKSKMIYKKGI